MRQPVWARRSLPVLPPLPGLVPLLRGPLIPGVIFAVISVSWAMKLGLSGFDAWLYREGSVAWLAGLDPWQAGTPPAHYAGSPLSLIAFAPATIIPEQLFRWGFVLVSAVMLGHAFRHRRVYWLYPPTVLFVIGGNPGGLMVALLMANSNWTRGFAVWIKSYAVLPAIGERAWRGLAVSAFVALLTFVALPDLWLSYIRELPMIASRLANETGHGGTIYEAPQLVPFAVVALVYLARVDLRAAGWLAIPALWPAQEFSNALLLAPVVGPWTALIPIIRPQASGATLAVIAYALVLFLKRRAAASDSRPSPAPDPSGPAMPPPVPA